MSKVALISFFFLFAFHSAYGWDEDVAKKKKYHIAVHATNPLCAMIKYGGAIEFRKGKQATCFSYTKYVSAYAGKQIGVEWDKYFKTEKQHEYFMYLRGTIGTATFDSKKLAIYGEKTDIVIGEEGYAGVAAGFGRRYNFTALFIRWNLGVKYCPILDEGLTDPEKAMFRLFHTTGPGSIIELNFRIGVQL